MEAGKPATRSRLGGISLVVALSSWAILVLVLLVGGLDPSSGSVGLLRMASVAALLAAIVALILGIGALVRGSQRLAAAFGLVVSLLFLLYFTGFGFALLA